MESKLETQNVTPNKEIEETSSNVRELVVQLRNLTGERYPKLRLPPDGDNILERCLRHRKFNMNEAACQVHCFFKLFYNLNKMKGENLFVPSLHRAYFFDSLSSGILKQRDPQGTSILFTNFDAMPGATFCSATGLALSIMFLHERFYHSVDKQDMKVIILANMKGFHFAHAKQISLSRLRALAEIIQGAVPVSFTAIHCINVPLLFLNVFKLLKPFLRQKIKNRIHLHGNDLTEFYKVVEKRLLPIALEGDLPNEEAIDMDFAEAICKKDEYYKNFARYGYMSGS